jgi:hypothetical protein
MYQPVNLPEYNMHLTNRLVNELEANGLEIISVIEIDYGHQIRLECGAIINVYTTGKVVVQGKLHPYVQPNLVALLQQILPSHTTFPPSMVPKPVTKFLVRRPDGRYVDRHDQWHAAEAQQGIASSARPQRLKALPNLVVDELGNVVPEE